MKEEKTYADPSGEGQIAEAIKRTDVPNLDVLPCGPVPPNTALGPQPARGRCSSSFANSVKKPSATLSM